MSTHMPTLIWAVNSTKGDVCELGSGFNSTPLLHWMCQGRNLVTYENDPEYFHFAKKFQTNTHRVRGLDEVDYEKHWSVVFIDHTADRGENPHKRGDDAIKFKNADLIILHDSEDPIQYGYDKVWPLFKYRKDWTEHRPNTTVVSNTTEL